MVLFRKIHAQHLKMFKGKQPNSGKESLLGYFEIVEEMSLLGYSEIVEEMLS